MKVVSAPSIYYASDKNVFDALNEHKVDKETIFDLFRRRNTLVSKATPREALARRFSLLTHDLYDHRDIAEKIGVVPRRERITSLALGEAVPDATLSEAIEHVRSSLEQEGSVVQVLREGTTVKLEVQYSTVDYRQNEFRQVQVRDGVVEFVKEQSGRYIVRATQNEYLVKTRDFLLNTIDELGGNPISRSEVSLADIPDPRPRSEFFHRLVTDLPGFARRDVTDVYVYKPRQNSDDDDTSDIDEQGTYVERVSLRGEGISRSQLLDKLAREDYYIVKIVWQTKQVFGQGHLYELEAVFADVVSCSGFSFIVRGVYQSEPSGGTSPRKRAPLRSEVSELSSLIEGTARTVADEIRKSFQCSGNSDGD